MSEITLLSRLATPDALGDAPSWVPQAFEIAPVSLAQTESGAALWWTLDQRLVLGGVALGSGSGWRATDMSSQYALLSIEDCHRSFFPVEISQGEAKRTLLGPHRVCLFQADAPQLIVLRPELWAVRARLGL